MDIELLIGGYLYIAVAVIVIIYILKKIIKKEGFTAIDKALPIIIFGTGFLYIIALAFHYSEEIGLSNKLQILLMFGLVAVTAFYAWSASRQADANVKMAEEMRETRYDGVRPAIDFKRDTAKIDIARLTLEANAASSEDTSHGLSCILCNVGLGPAIDVRSFIEHPERGRLPFEFGTIESRGKTERWILSISHEGNRIALVACYEDIYGRTLRSSREVSIDRENHDWKLGRLKVVPVQEEGAQQ
ncbi:MAG: hypothetical protein WBH01_08110 [Dehalococcoidia bacterium]